MQERKESSRSSKVPRKFKDTHTSIPSKLQVSDTQKLKVKGDLDPGDKDERFPLST